MAEQIDKWINLKDDRPKEGQRCYLCDKHDRVFIGYPRDLLFIDIDAKLVFLHIDINYWMPCNLLAPVNLPTPPTARILKL